MHLKNVPRKIQHVGVTLNATDALLFSSVQKLNDAWGDVLH